MEDSYISNIHEDDQILESEYLEKIHKLESEIDSLKLKLAESDKKIITQKHQIENMEIELSNKNNEIKNLEVLINFYKKEKGDNNQIQEYIDKIKNLEESLLVKNKKIEEINKDLNEQYSINEKLINALTEKDKIKKEEDVDSDDSNDLEKINDTKKFESLQDKIEELEETINELNKDKENIADKYEDKIQEIKKENNDYQNQISELENEIKEINQKYEIEKLKNSGKPEIEKEIEMLFKEQIENLKNEINEEKEKIIMIKEKAKEQRESDMKEILYLEKNLEELKEEMSSLKKEKESIIQDKKTLEETNKKLIKLNKELETISTQQYNTDLLLNNYKSILDKKNIEIDNLTSKCKEFKETLDQYEKEKDTNLESFNNEKQILKSELEEKNKKIGIIYRELNELRAKEGKGEADITKISEDPKQKLYDEIKELKSNLEKKEKENIELNNKLENYKINNKNELEAQNEYLKGLIEGYKQNIDNLKEQKNKEKKDFVEQLEKLDMEMGNCKCQIAAVQYESDRKLINYINYVKKLQRKLESLGFKFKDKNKNLKGFGSFMKANTMV